MALLFFILFFLGLVFLASYYCYRITFYAKPRAPLGPDEYEVPKGRIYDPHRDTMIGWMKEVRKLPRQDVTITSFDGLKLTGSYYQWCPGAVTELMFHGYRGSAERDLCGGVHRAFSLGHNVLIVDQRTSFRSQGNTITFGINEHRDCLSWIDFAIDFLGKDCRLILTGISMGASTVLMAAGKGVPKNVVGVLADCGYHEAKAIILKHAQRMKLPAKLVYPFIKLGARLFGHFDLEEYSPIEAMKTIQVPVIFFHGDTDTFVPPEMSQENFNACVAPKRLVLIPGAGHGLAYIMDPDRYLREMAEFFTENGVPTQVEA